MVNSDVLRGARKEYRLAELDSSSVSGDPFVQFKRWFEEACQSEPVEPNAFALATVSATNSPSLRIVLLKAFDERGFVFYTNFESRKGSDISVCPSVAMLFYWPSLERQLRIEGRVEKVSNLEADEYFSSRPLSARIGAIVSQQSQEVPSRDVMQRAYSDECARIEDSEATRPSHWGGYRVVPCRYEFWQGRESRLHDRIVFELSENYWRINRLWP